MSRTDMTLTKILEHRAYAVPDRIALQCGNDKLTYQDFYRESERFAQYLRSKKLTKGDRIGILSHNDIRVAVFVFGALKCGISIAQLNWWLTPDDLTRLTSDTEIKILFYGSGFQELIDSSTLKMETSRIHEVESFTIKSSEKIADDSDVNVSSFHLFTSGTTGQPKGIVLKQSHLLSVCHHVIKEFPGMGYGQVSLIAVPLFNIAGLAYLITTIYNGGKAVFLPGFDPESVLQSLKNDEISILFLPPALIHTLIQHMGDNAHHFPCLRLLHYGGAPISANLLKEVSRTFKCELIQGYGLSETSGLVSLLRPEDHRKILNGENTEIISSAGKPVEGMEIKIVGDDGKPVENGEVGELYVRGDSVIDQYWKNRNSDSFEQDWFKTGDFVRQNTDGYLFIEDRKNDLIITKGVNVYPSEIERVLRELSCVDQVCVLGMPSDAYGEMIVAVVVSREEAIEKKLTEHAAKNLANYKRPRKYVFIDELPKNLAGKVVRRQLAEKLLISS